MPGICFMMDRSTRKRYTRSQAQAGGRISGETRRLQSRERHAQVRALYHRGWTQIRIAVKTGYAQSTISRILNGVIRTCLTARETIARIAPYPKDQNIREVIYGQGDLGYSIPISRKERGRRGYFQPIPCLFCDGSGWMSQPCPCCGRHKEGYA